MSDLMIISPVIVVPIILFQLTAEYLRNAEKRNVQRAADAERRRCERLKQRGHALRSGLTKLIEQLDAFLPSAAGKRMENELQSLRRNMLSILDKHSLCEENDITDTEKQLKALRRLLAGTIERAEANQLTAEVGEHQAILLHLKRQAAAGRLLSIRFDPKGLQEVEAQVSLVESYLKQRNTSKAQQEMGRLQELFARHHTQIEQEQDRWNRLQEEASTTLASAQERLASLQTDKVVRRWRASDLEILAHRVEQLGNSISAGRFAQVQQEYESLISEADKLVVAAEKAQRCQEQRDYIARSIVESMAEVGFWAEQLPLEQALVDTTIRATSPDGRAITVSVPLEGPLRWTTEGFPMEVFTGNDGQPTPACDEAARQIELVKTYLSERHGVETGELSWKGKDPNRPSKAAKRLPRYNARHAQRTREA